MKPTKQWLCIGLVSSLAVATAQAQQPPQASQPVVRGTGTANTIPLWLDPSTLGNSILVQSAGKIGVGTPTPTATLDV